MKRWYLAAGCLLMSAAPRLAAAQAAFESYGVVDSIPVGRVTGDLYAIDVLHRRLYGAGNTVIDIDQKRVVGTVPDSNGGGFAIAPDVGRGVIRDGLVFDLATGAAVAHVDAEGDGYAYDRLTKRAFLFAPDVAVIDVASARLVGRVPLNSPTESAVADGAGLVYVVLSNIEKPAIAAIDARTLAVHSRWPLRNCATPRALAMDRQRHRLFVSCAKLVVIMDSNSGQLVGSVPVAGLADQAAFDETTGLLFSPNGDDGLAIVRQDAPDNYSMAQLLVDRRIHSHKIVLDPTTHRVYMPNEDRAGNLSMIVLAPEATAVKHGR
jgi:hypothetical protein